MGGFCLPPSSNSMPMSETKDRKNKTKNYNGMCALSEGQQGLSFLVYYAKYFINPSSGVTSL